MARALAQELSELWDQPVTVENAAGAGATAGPAQVANSPADGYTLLVNTSAHAYSAALLKNLPYDPLKDFIPIAPLTSQPYVLVAGKAAGVTTSASSLRRLRRRRVSSSLAPLALPQIRDGRLVALGVSSARRSSLLSEVPTIAEAGVAGFDYPIWYGVWAPAGTPTVVVNKLAKDIARAMPEMRDWLAEHGADPMSMTQAEFARFVLGESEMAARIINAAGIKPQKNP